jgi:hypothetical protein
VALGQEEPPTALTALAAVAVGLALFWLIRVYPKLTDGIVIMAALWIGEALAKALHRGRRRFGSHNHKADDKET